jgi:hypothetical protein
MTLDDDSAILTLTITIDPILLARADEVIE